MPATNETPVASARALGAVVRKTLKALGLGWKVQCKTVSFAGFGYGASPFAEIFTERALTYLERSVLADALRELRSDPDGGSGIIQMSGKAYAFGGSIGHASDPSGEDFWIRYALDVEDFLGNPASTPAAITPVMKEAARQAEAAFAAARPSLARDSWVSDWLASGAEFPTEWGSDWADLVKNRDMGVTS